MTARDLSALRVPAQQSVKHLVQRAIGRGRPAVLIASIGRSGSTLVHRSILEAAARTSALPTYLARLLFHDTAWDLSAASLQPGVIYKTHDLARNSVVGQDIRAVFLFGAASDAALSVLSCQRRYGNDWVQEHFDHLHAHGQAQDLLHRDALGFERQIRSWSKPRPYPIALVHYEAIWDHQRVLSDFLGLPVELPARRSRAPHGLGHGTERRVRSTFRELDEWIEGLPRFRLLPAEA